MDILSHIIHFIIQLFQKVHKGSSTLTRTCQKKIRFLHDLAMKDYGSLKRSDNAPSISISISTSMTGFNGKCMGMVESCALYCKGPTSGDQVCFRGLNIATQNISDYEEIVLEVTDNEGILQPDHKLYTNLVCMSRSREWDIIQM